MEVIPTNEFSTTQIVTVGKYENIDDALGLYVNYSDNIEEMSELLKTFYENFGKERNYVLIALYVPIIPIAMIANILVIVVVFKNHYMRSATNYFVVNLSVADLLVTTICMPMSITQAISITEMSEEILCKLVSYLQGVAVAASVFTIMVMSIDRYLAIRNPIAFRRVFNRKRMSIVIAAIWLVSLGIFCPLLKAVTVHRLDQYNITLGIPGSSQFSSVKTVKPPLIPICFEDLKSLGINAHLFGAACFVLIYAIPGTVVLVVYLLMGRTLYTRKPPFDTDSIKGSTSFQQGSRLVRERKRVAWILLILAILFALCWLPYNVLRLLVDLGVINGNEHISDVLSYCLFLGHANSMLNPVVYCFMTRTFRRSISEILCHSWCGCSKRKPHRNNLATAVWACSSRGRQNRPQFRERTHLAGMERGNQSRIRRTRSATTSTLCDSSNSHSPHRRCYKYTVQAILTSDRSSKEIALRASKNSEPCPCDDEAKPRGKSFDDNIALSYVNIETVGNPHREANNC